MNSHKHDTTKPHGRTGPTDHGVSELKDDLNSHSVASLSLILAGRVLFFALNRVRVRLDQGVRRVL